MQAENFGSFDYVIVGGGSAGCLLANRLSADPSTRVLLLEAGRGGERFWHSIPAGYKFTIGKPATDWCFATEPEPELDNRPIAFPRGIGLGGSSLINGMIYTRGHRRDFDRWTQAGAIGWGWDDVLPFFKQHECREQGASAAHGEDGELHVQSQPVVFPFLSLIAQAATQAGIPKTDDFNTGENEGVGWYQVTQRGGRRWSAARAFLDPTRHRTNLRIVTEARAARITFDGRRANGITFRLEGVEWHAQVSGEVILAAGSIHSPWLLEMSGIGAAGRVAGLGIEPLADLPGVGENLQDHLQVRQIYRLSGVNTLNQPLGSLIGRARIAAHYALFRGGPMCLAASQLGIFTKSRPDKDIADLQYHVIPYSADRLGGDPHEYPGITMSVCQLDPQSRGSVHARIPDLDAAPEIRANYLSQEEDKAVMLAGLRRTREIMAQPALAPLQPVETIPGPAANDDESLLAAIRQGGGSIFHPVGTCAMGAGPGAVLDARLRVHGVQGLRVADASAMPSVPSANTAAATMMIAERAAAFILQDRVAAE